MAKAFVYIEIDNSPDSPRKGQPIYTLHYNGNPRGCCKIMQSPDKDFFIQEIIDLKRKNKLILVSKLPAKLKSLEGTIERSPYDLSRLK